MSFVAMLIKRKNSDRSIVSDTDGLLRRHILHLPSERDGAQNASKDISASLSRDMHNTVLGVLSSGSGPYGNAGRSARVSRW